MTLAQTIMGKAIGGMLLGLMVLASSNQASGQTASKGPVIQSIRIEEDEVVVVALIPEGVRKVTLESRSRVNGSTWIPRLVTRLTQSGVIEFRLPARKGLELLRIRGDANEPLPARFYEGAKRFAGETTLYEVPVSFGGPVPERTDADDGAGGAPSRDVVESDIWRIDGNTLYFFNQLRGLQVIDIQNPDQPEILGQLSLPAAGEQMYVLNSETVVLLANERCGWGQNGPQNEVLIVKVDGGTPVVAAALPVEGQIQESRLVGSALYVAAQTYRPVPVTRPDEVGPDGRVSGIVAEPWEWGTLVRAFDLSDPGQPVERGTLWFSGSGNTISATDQFLFVATQDHRDWWRSTVQVVDISAPDGTMHSIGSVRVAGRVADKFKMNLNGSVFTVISHARLDNRGWVTTLETFSLADPAAPEALGRIELAEGEQLHATRFDGDRVYIVTFFRIDPLWIVDLSEPRRPEILGELEVPGWSTYIEPMGDRLIAVGIDNEGGWRVAVSLFDVADPAKPSLLDKVPLGENHSWSEANDDEKAFNVLKDEGLILVPYQGDSQSGQVRRVQLIDFDEDSLEARGAIDHSFQPRRTAFHKERILSISGTELLAVDVTDRDAPVVKSETELAWTVDRVFLKGDYVLEIESQSGWETTAAPPAVRVGDAQLSDLSLFRLELAESWPIAGATVRGDYLYLIQIESTVVPVPWIDVVRADGAQENPPEPVPPEMVLTVVDLRQLPELSVAGEARAEAPSVGWSPTLTAVWPRTEVLVWAGSGGAYWGPYRGGIGFAEDIAGPWYPWWGGQGGRLLAFDVTSPAAPEFASSVNLQSQDNRWDFSSPFAAEGLVYLSHQSSEFLEGQWLPGQVRPEPKIIVDEETGERIVVEPPPPGVWVRRHFLDVVDFADPSAPAVRAPVNIPGRLEGISHAGAMVYTVAPHWDDNGRTDWHEWLDASAYDGVEVSLVASLDLTQAWPHPLTIDDEGVAFIGRPGTDDSAVLQSWSVSDAGEFVQLGEVELKRAAQALVLIGDLLAVQSDGVSLFDVSNPSELQHLGSDRPQGCLWFDLEKADGTVERGLWVPLGAYGVWRVELER